MYIYIYMEYTYGDNFTYKQSQIRIEFFLLIMCLYTLIVWDALQAHTYTYIVHLDQQIITIMFSFYAYIIIYIINNNNVWFLCTSHCVCVPSEKGNFLVGIWCIHIVTLTKYYKLITYISQEMS